MVYTITVHLYAKDDPEAINKLKLKLIEASRVYRNDTETLDWQVMQDVHDPRAFTIVERYEQESVRTPPRDALMYPFDEFRSCNNAMTQLLRIISTEPAVPPWKP
jgi:hypothetical protein